MKWGKTSIIMRDDFTTRLLITTHHHSSTSSSRLLFLEPIIPTHYQRLRPETTQPLFIARNRSLSFCLVMEKVLSHTEIFVIFSATRRRMNDTTSSNQPPSMIFSHCHDPAHVHHWEILTDLGDEARSLPFFSLNGFCSERHKTFPAVYVAFFAIRKR
jgi:hypothetical protein